MQMSETNVRPGKGKAKTERSWQVFERNAQANPHIDKAIDFLREIDIEHRVTERGLELVATAYVAQPGDGVKDFSFHGTFAIGISDRDKLQLILEGKGHRAMTWKQKLANAQDKEARAAETAAHGIPIDTAGSIEQAERQIAGITDPAMKAKMLRSLADMVEPAAVVTPVATAAVADVLPPHRRAPAPRTNHPVTVAAPDGLSDEDIDKALAEG